MMARWAGVYVNGWHDLGARDWDIEDSDQMLDPPAVIDGGVASVAVVMPPPPQDVVGQPQSWIDQHGTWVGGPQAITSPIGRGSGWGDVGHASLRRSVAQALAALTTAQDPTAARVLLAATRALSQGCERLVLAVPDTPYFAEAAQGRYLAAMRQPRGPRSILLWRSVALFLGLMQNGIVPRDAIGQRVRLLIHDAEGLELQDLTLADAFGFPGHAAPERRGFGRLILPELGLGVLLSKAQIDLLSSAPELAQRIECSRAASLDLLSDGAPELEILRLANGNWHQNRARAVASPLPQSHRFEDLPPTDITVLASPLRGNHLTDLLHHLTPLFPGIQLAQWCDIAVGALYAGRLIERGLPHYLERLEPIALAVMTLDDARFEPLIEIGRSVPANREYVSPVISGFRWPSTKSRIEFHVLKGEREVRTWVAETTTPPEKVAEVELQLRQVPGQSWAKLQATSNNWTVLSQNPIQLDWEKLDPDPRSPDEILETLRRPAPGYPRRVVEAAHIGFWDGTISQPGLSELLRTPGASLYEGLNRSSRLVPGSVVPDSRGQRFRPISTDGTLPSEVSAEDAEQLDQALAVAWARHHDLEARSRLQMSNRPYLTLTWAFTRCPVPLQHRIIEALEAYDRVAYHPFHDMEQATKILQHGAGRVVAQPDLLARLLRALLRHKPATADTRAALSFVLTRRKDISAALDDGLVDAIGSFLADTCYGLIEQRRFKQDFVYCLNAIAGLLRYREAAPLALLVGRSAIANRLHEQLSQASHLVPLAGEHPRKTTQLVEAISELLLFLAGAGGDPDILLKLDLIN